MFRDRSEHSQPFLLVGFGVLGVKRNPRVDPLYFASSTLSLHLYICVYKEKRNL
jgi:hypothetical protein